MASSYRYHSEAESFERAVGEYLRACGYRTFGESSTHERGRAPLVHGSGGANSYASADIPAIKDGHGAFFEVKWKSETFVSKYGNVCTGIDLDPYRAYLDHERDSGWPLVIVFCHRKEGEVRCATLAQLQEIESHRCAQRHFPRSKGGMINWKYERIPFWMPYSELELLSRSYRDTRSATRPSPPPLEIKQPVPETQSSTSASNWHRSHENRQTFLNIDVSIPDTERGGLHQIDGRRKVRR